MVAGASVVAGAGTLLVASTVGVPLAGALTVGGAVAGGAATMRSNYKFLGNLLVKLVRPTSSMFGGLVSFNKKHNISGKAFKAANNTIKKAQAINEQYKVTDNIGKAVSATAQQAAEVNKEYKVTDKVCSAVASGLDQISKLAGGDEMMIKKTTARRTRSNLPLKNSIHP